jgi:hypothetical protein
MSSSTFEVGDVVLFTGYPLDPETGKKPKGCNLTANTQVSIDRFITGENGEELVEIQNRAKRFDVVPISQIAELAEEKTSRTSKLTMKAALEKDKALTTDLDAVFKPLATLGDGRYDGPISEQDTNWHLEILTGVVDIKGKPRKNVKDERYEWIASDYIKQKFDESPNQDVVQLAVDLLREVERGYFRLGGLFGYISTNNIWTRYKDVNGEYFKSFGDFIDSGYFPKMKRRRAWYYMRAYMFFTNWGLTEDDVVEIGWHAANMITHVACKETAREWVEAAKTHTYLGLNRIIKKVLREREENPGVTGKTEEELFEAIKTKSTLSVEAFVDEEHDTSKPTTLQVHFKSDELENFEAVAAALAKKNPGLKTDDRSKVVDLLVKEYMLNPDNGVVHTPYTVIDYAEAIFPEYEAILVNRKTGEILAPRYEDGEVTLTIQKNEAKFLNENSEAEAEMV